MEDQSFCDELRVMSDDTLLETWRMESLAGGLRMLSLDDLGDPSRTFRLAMAERVAFERFGVVEWLNRYRKQFPQQTEYPPGQSARPVRYRSQPH